MREASRAPRLEAVSTEAALARVRASLETAATSSLDLRVLDAGCGSDSARAGFPVPPWFRQAHVVGVDVSREALEQNALLDERLVGDIQSMELPAAAYDIVVCWDVLEHLREPMRAVENLTRAVRPSGLLVIGVPNLWSLKALVTKATPFWFHRFAYKRIFGRNETDSGPFHTYLRRSIAPRHLQRELERRGFSTEVGLVYGSDVSELFGSRRMLVAVWRIASLLATTFSFGRIRSTHTETAFVFRRPIT